MKHFWIVVLGLFLNGCYSPAGPEDDMSQGNPQYGRSGGWSAFKNLRNNGTDNGGLQANFLAGRDENAIPSKNFTVQFSVDNIKSIDPTFNNQIFINPVADITWSVEGNPVRRQVSVINGCSVTGVGQAVKVVVTDQTPQAGVRAGTYDVGITVAPGSRPSENQPAILNPLLATTAQGFIDVPPGTNDQTTLIPQAAGVISVYVTAIADDLVSPLAPMSAVVLVRGVAGNISKVYDPNQIIGFVPIGGVENRIELVNNLPPGPGVPGIIFTVTFGIDG